MEVNLSLICSFIYCKKLLKIFFLLHCDFLIFTSWPIYQILVSFFLKANFVSIYFDSLPDCVAAPLVITNKPQFLS